MKKLLIVLLTSGLSLIYSNIFSQVTDTLPTEDRILVKFLVTDYDSIPEWGAVVHLESDDKKIKLERFTDLEGKATCLVPKGQIYKIWIVQYGRKFNMGTFDTPNKKGKITFDQDLEIKLVTKYIEDYTLQNISFKTGSSELTPESYPAMDELIGRLQKTPKSYVEIAGHSDNQGDPKKNMLLSQARANAVRNYLISKGIPANQTYSKGYGSRLPVYSNDNEEGRRKNRRIEVRFIEII